jgi:hypothetical protein
VKLEGLIDIALPMVCAAALLSACCRQYVRREGPPPAQRPWCATVEAKLGDLPLDAEGCATTRAACETAVARARRWGGLAGISAVSDCARRP